MKTFIFLYSTFATLHCQCLVQLPPPPAPSSPLCTVAGSSVLANFSSCATLGDNILTVYWNALPSSSFSTPSASTTTSSNNITIKFRISGLISGNEWLALGFPSTPGQMIGSTAQVLISCVAGSSPAICSPGNIKQGAVLKDYFLGDKNSRAVAPPGRLVFNDIEAQSDGTGNAYGRFEVSLPADLIRNGQLNVLYARGRCNPTTGLLQQHETRAAANLDLASGASSNTAIDSSSEAKKNAHAWLMVVGWTLLLIGALIARSFNLSRAF